jgi:N-methylhydantoinase B
VDFTGTAPQVRTNLNAPFASTVSATVSCVKAALSDPDIPFNHGAMRPITVTAPKGSLLNPHHPAAVRARMEACSRAWDATMKALSNVAPERVVATGYDTTTAFCLSHLGKNGWSVSLEILGGGLGAASDKDGCDAVDNPLSNCANTPTEALDQDFSFFRLLEYALRADSCGIGRHRGGVGFTRRYEILEDGVKLALYSDRFTRPADGLFGGHAAATGFCEIIRGGERIPVKSKFATELRKGDIVTISLGGGGGYGEPALRPTEEIEEDVRDGIITRFLAARWRASAGE